MLIRSIGRALACAGVLAVTSVATTDALSTAASNGPSSPIRDGLGLTPATDYVTRLQSALRELGYYTGAGTGILDSATNAAVRAYQRSIGLTEDVLLDDALLARVEADLARSAVLARLAKARNQEIQTAQQLLRRLGAPHGRLAIPVSAGPIAAAEPANCRDRPTATCLLTEATTSTASVTRDDLRDQALAAIATVQTRAGLTDAALATIDRIKDARVVIARLRELAAAEATGRQFDDGLRALLSAPAGDAASAAVNGDGSGTAAPLQEIHRLAGTGDFAEAEELAWTLAEERYRPVALADIAVAAATAGASEQANALFGKAATTARAIARPFPRSYALYHVGRAALRGAGNGDETSIAIAQEMAAAVENAQLRADLLWRIHAAHLRRGDPSAAAETEGAATAATAAVVGALGRVWLFADLAELLEQHGRTTAAWSAFDKGLSTVDTITSPWERARALTRLAAARLRLSESGRD